MVDVWPKGSIPPRTRLVIARRHSRGVHGRKTNRSKFICPDGGMVDTEDSKSSAFGCAGSSPALGTSKILSPFTSSSWYEMEIIKLDRIKQWIDIINPSVEEVDEIMEKYDFHSLDRDAILEENQYARIDTYDDYLFIVLHFPKLEPRSKRYIHNEFNIFISKNYLITFRYFNTSAVKQLQEKYQDINAAKKEMEDEDMPFNTGIILYELIDNLLIKVMRMIEYFWKDLRMLENELLSSNSEKLIEEIMIKKRNIITLKHMIKPQIAVLKLIEIRMNELFNGEVELYFENLEDKLDKIYSDIQLLQENIDSMEDTLKSVFELKTNTTMKHLTIFSAVMLPLTLVTSFFGMNVEQATFPNSIILFSILFTFVGLGIFVYFLMRWPKLSFKR